MVYKILISAVQGYEGITIYDNRGIPVAKYGSESQIGPSNGFHITINGQKLSFYDGVQEVAYVSNQQLYITKTVVLDEMELGNKWVFKIDPNDDSIFLKWIGGNV